ncbi:zinc finger protein ZAT4-like [Raphanus sativus]|uniref:Zinc finger protein ZAT4-like n=1 Tax=Raphanus sativus TaxID=3726 RepID=A0A6J0MSC8_RAPSA|nr:zinc finger protein ZAT4-like [Raphanus sativus]
MERYKCRLCFKSFINGRALGGHMRSHILTLPSKRELYELTARPSQLSEETESDASASSDEEEDDVNCGEFESETESSRMNPTRKRSKRTRKLGSFDFEFKKVRTSQPGEVVTEPEHHSSASDTTTEEDLAFCLIMLSRDKWKQQKNKTIVVEEEDDDECEDYKSSKNSGGRGRFKCETCGKVFKSYQALGGHRASHKKNKTFTTMTSTKTEHEKTEYSNGVTEKKVHQCPICFRVFTSGQALGGHKRSHGSNNIGSRREFSVNQSVPSVKEEEEVEVKQRMIDLNLPAPNEDDETSVVFNEW